MSEPPFKSRLVIVITESGSSTYLHFIDPSSCAAKWPRIKAFTEDIRIPKDRIEFLPACACDTAEIPCSCSAAQVYSMKVDSAPVLLEQESRALTKLQLGVEFTGDRKVLHPRTPKAQLTHE